MIDVIKMTPAQYSAQSRDYQVIARLYSALFNISKSYIDSMTIWNNDIDNRLITLRSRTLNFITRHSWDENDLEAVTSCFKYLMRNKGTMKALEYCVNILMKIENLSGEGIEEPVSIDNYNVTIRVPENLLTIGILEDLIDYILPAGLTFDIEIYKTVGLGELLKTELVYEDGEITSEKLSYSDEMVIGPSIDIDLSDGGESVLKLDDSKKVWLGIHNLESESWVPDDNAGLTSATLITSNGEENPIDLEKGGGKKVELIIPKEDKMKTKNITDTFVYIKKDGPVSEDISIEKDGKVVYEEDWQ